MAQYVGAMAAADTPDTSSGAFLSAVLSVRRGDYGVAKVLAALHPPALSCTASVGGQPSWVAPVNSWSGIP